MICPHCSESLTFKQRSGRTCEKCRKKFVLEPRDTQLRLHDLRLRRVAEQISDDGYLPYTDTQLWYAVSRRYLRARAARFNPRSRRRIAAAVWTAVALALYLITMHWFFLLILVPSALILVVRLVRPWRPWKELSSPMPLATFREATREWQAIYGQPPVGLLAGNGPVLTKPAGDDTLRFSAVLLCADQDVVACLRASGTVERLGLRVIRDVGELATCSPRLAVLVLRDASVSGEHLVATARRAAGPRVIDLGLQVAQARRSRAATRVCTPRLVQADALAALRAQPQGLHTEDLEWLAEGWWSPVAALPPERLIALVGDAVDQVTARSDPDRAIAKAVGFLSWPAA